MDIFDFALKMEKDGENFYRDLIKKSDNKGVNAILTMLADGEVKHYNIIAEMKKEASLEYDAPELLGDVKNVFDDMKADKVDLSSLESQVELYEQARDTEAKSRDFYAEKAKETDNAKYKEILLKLAEEEHKHYYVLDNIIELLCKPERWVEDAEFYPYEAF